MQMQYLVSNAFGRWPSFFVIAFQNHHVDIFTQQHLVAGGNMSFMILDWDEGLMQWNVSLLCIQKPFI